MAYGLQYYFEFNDSVGQGFTPILWRIELNRKDYTGASAPLPLMSSNPISVTRSAEDEDRLSPIIGAKAVIRLTYVGDSTVPHPNNFTNIQEDTYQVSLYKNGVLDFRGFIKPDATQYPFPSIAPFSYEINATDYFNVMKSTPMNLANPGLLYDKIALSSFFDRTLFSVIDYSGLGIKILFRIKPDVIAAANNIVSHIFLHTDAFFNLDDGPVSVYDALVLFLKAMRCRMFFSAGFYWIQRISDVSVDYTTVLLKNTFFGATTVAENKPVSIYGEDFYILDRSGIVSVTPGMSSQKTTYTFQALNTLTNFTWEILEPSGWPQNWDTLVGGNVQRLGAGIPSDLYRMKVWGDTGGAPWYLSQGSISIRSGQFIGVDVKGFIYWTTGIKVRVNLVPLSGPSIDPQYLNSDGSWSNNPDNEVLVSGDKKTRQGSISLTSKKVPGTGNVFSMSISILENENADDPDDPPPVGTTPYNEVYPVFLRVFESIVEGMESNTKNDKVYSKVGEDEDLFFLDTGNDHISNTLYYNNGTNYVPLPLDNWRDIDTNTIESSDWYTGRTILDNFNVAANKLEADILSNTVEFYQALSIPDIDEGIRLIQISDTYDVKTGVHKMAGEQIYDKESGTGSYNIKSIVKT